VLYLTFILQWYCVVSIGLSALHDIKVQNENIFLNTFLTDVAGMIAPWYADEQGAGDFLLSKFQLREGNGAVEVSEKGLYYIYAQVRLYQARVMIICYVLFVMCSNVYVNKTWIEQKPNVIGHACNKAN